jgi:hypothetical protein
MLTHKIALVGAAVASLLIADAAVARTHHPSTPAERQATDDLNAKSLADARAATAGMQPTASTIPQPSLSPAPSMSPAPETSAPDATTAPAPEQPEQPDTGK